MEEDSVVQDVGFSWHRDVIHKSWTGDCPEDWLIGTLKMLYKGKGLKDVLDNWRGIMLLDVVAKVVCAIISNRLAKYIQSLEEQNCFKFECCTIDGLFGLKIALHKRKEHGLSS